MEGPLLFSPLPETSVGETLPISTKAVSAHLLCYVHPMDRGRSEVQCIVREGELVVSLPGDDFCAVYHKPTNQPQLILKRRTQTDDYVVLARAWQAANDKARELGWIV
jgi:hypothetical protein